MSQSIVRSLRPLHLLLTVQTVVVILLSINRLSSLRSSLEGSLVAKAVQKLAERWNYASWEEEHLWEGTATSLHEELGLLVFDERRKARLRN